MEPRLSGGEDRVGVDSIDWKFSSRDAKLPCLERRASGIVRAFPARGDAEVNS